MSDNSTVAGRDDEILERVISIVMTGTRAPLTPRGAATDGCFVADVPGLKCLRGPWRPSYEPRRSNK